MSQQESINKTLASLSTDPKLFWKVVRESSRNAIRLHTLNGGDTEHLNNAIALSLYAGDMIVKING